MFWLIVHLRIQLWLDRYLLPAWMHNRNPDKNHPYRRLFTRSHQLKRGLVKTIWISAGLLLLANPVLPMVLAIALPTTILSFAILDETP